MRALRKYIDMKSLTSLCEILREIHGILQGTNKIPKQISETLMEIYEVLKRSMTSSRRCTTNSRKL